MTEYELWESIVKTNIARIGLDTYLDALTNPLSKRVQDVFKWEERNGK